MNCTKCKKPFTCGCQKTRAKDGATVHKTCKTSYEADLKSTVKK